MSKICSRCKEEKKLTDFYKNKIATDGHMYTCKTCSDALAVQWAKENPERRLEQRRKSNEKRREARRLYARKKYYENKD